MGVLLFVCLLVPAAPQAPPAASPLTLEDVVKMSQNGFSEDLIITKIKKSGKAFDLSTDELLELRRRGVTDTVVRYLLDPSQPYTQPPLAVPPTTAPARSEPAGLPPKPDMPVRKYPEDAYVGRVPRESGLYCFLRASPDKVDLRLLLGESDGPGLGKVLMKKGRVTAYLVGAAAKFRVSQGTPVFYIRLPEGKSIEELLLLTLSRKSDRREIDAGTPGPKPQFRRESMRPFDSLEVAAGVFRLAPANLPKAEYLFYLLGSAEPPKGNYGKGYDFGVDVPQPPPKKE